MKDEIYIEAELLRSTDALKLLIMMRPRERDTTFDKIWAAIRPGIPKNFIKIEDEITKKRAFEAVIVRIFSVLPRLLRNGLMDRDPKPTRR